MSAGMPRALITGGAGFIGANLVRHLESAGWSATVFDDLSAGSREALDGTRAALVVDDVLDTDALRRAANGHDVMLHLAAGAGVVASLEDPMANFRVNAGGVVSALWAARKAGVPRFVFSSSNAPLGPNAQPAREDAPLHPLSPYGASKMTGEGYAVAFYEAYGIEAVVVRFSNAYGPHSRHKTNVIPTFIRAIERAQPVVVYGDGEQTRDFVYVADLCHSLTAAATVPAAAGQVFPVASGVETTINEVVARLGALVGDDLRVERRPARRGEVAHSSSVIDKAREVLALGEPTALDAGLRETLAYFAATARRSAVEQSRA
jgi:UDP-glucose 4-epimerase